MFEEYKDVIRVEDMMEMLKVGKNRAYDLLNSGKIKAFRIGNIYKIPKKSVIEYIENELVSR